VTTPCCRRSSSTRGVPTAPGWSAGDALAAVVHRADAAERQEPTPQAQS
jgi:hypothetical protein